VLLLTKGNLLVLYEFEFVELNDHVFFELVPEFLNLFLLVRVILDVVLFLKDPLNLRELIPVLSYCRLELLHLFNHLAVDLLFKHWNFWFLPGLGGRLLGFLKLALIVRFLPPIAELWLLVIGGGGVRVVGVTVRKKIAASESFRMNWDSLCSQTI